MKQQKAKKYLIVLLLAQIGFLAAIALLHLELAGVEVVAGITAASLLIASLSGIRLAMPRTTEATVVVAQVAKEPSETEVAEAAEYPLATFVSGVNDIVAGDPAALVSIPKGGSEAERGMVKHVVQRIRQLVRIELEAEQTSIDTSMSEQPYSAAPKIGLNSPIRELEMAVERGQSAVKHGQESIREVRELLAEGNSRLRRIRDHSRSVRDGVELVKDLSEQTNVLALNAAIQASRSGEDGLSVVAEELQRVAVRGADSGRKLEQQLDTLRDDLSDTMNAIERGEQGVSSAMQGGESTNEAFAGILASSRRISEQAKA